MSAPDYLLLAGIAAACLLALRSIFRRRRRGGCSGCGGCCTGCGLSCPKAVPKEKAR